MKRILVGLALTVVLVLAVGGVALAQTQPEFKLGFKALADQIPDVVGQPLENERPAANGDSQQRTTTGLMAWRKSDNWTVFTNGARTWINGPFGVQERGNLERFDWEQVAMAEPPAVVSPAPPPPTPAAQPVGSLQWMIDAPKSGDTLVGCVDFSGWALDTRASGQQWNGIDDITVSAGSSGNRVSYYLRRIDRPDVAKALGRSEYAASGFRIGANCSGLPGGRHDFTVYVHSTVSGWQNKTFSVFIQPRSAYTAATVRSTITSGMRLGVAAPESLLRVATPELYGETTGDPSEVLKERQWMFDTMQWGVQLGVAPSTLMACLAYDEKCFIPR